MVEKPVGLSTEIDNCGNEVKDERTCMQSQHSDVDACFAFVLVEKRSNLENTANQVDARNYLKDASRIKR